MATGRESRGANWRRMAATGGAGGRPLRPGPSVTVPVVASPAELQAAHDRFEYGELRMIALDNETQNLSLAPFVDTAEISSALSLSRPTRPEVQQYLEKFKDQSQGAVRDEI